MAAALMAEARAVVRYPMASAVSAPAAVLMVRGLTAAQAGPRTPAAEFALSLPRECHPAAAAADSDLLTLFRARTSPANHSRLLRMLRGRRKAPRGPFS